MMMTYGNEPMMTTTMTYANAQRLDATDLFSVDSHAYRALRQLAADPISHAGDAESSMLVERLAGRFEIWLSDGTLVPVCPAGQDRVVTDENRVEYSQLALHTRLNEGQAQMRAIASGLSSLVPSSALHLLHWRELEALVTGQPEIDLALLREHTVWRSGEEGEEEYLDSLWQVSPATCLST